MITVSGSALAIQPQTGGAVDSLSDTARRRQAGARPAGGFSPDTEAAPGAETARKTRPSAGQAVMQLLRRRTDRGETADASIEIPPHLERRRAWREAFGLNTYHTQQLAQAGEDAEPAGDARSGAIRAYRSASWRGRLDLDLAQQFSVTV